MSRQPIELIQFGPSHDGTQQWWTTLKFLIEQDDSPPLIGGIAIDITPRMRAEQALRASEDRYRSLVELAGSVIVVVDPTAGSRSSTARPRRSLACRGPRRSTAATWSAASPSRTAPLCPPSWPASAPAKSLQGRESAFVQRDGTHKSFLWNATRLTDSSERQPAPAGHRPGHLGTAAARASVAAGPAHGRHRPAGRRHRT